MTGRELAWRVLAHEVRSSTEVERGIGEKAPSYVISPLGARMNRVLLAGTVTPSERAGGAGAETLVKAGLTDPTGTLPLISGSYQAQGQTDMEKISRPTSALVVGKVTLFRGPGPTPVPTVRVEAVHSMADPEYRTLMAESATQTLERLRLVLRFRSPDSPSDDDLIREGLSPAWTRGARASIVRYAAFDPAPFYESLRAVLVALRSTPALNRTAVVVPPPVAAPLAVVRVIHDRAAPSPPSAPPGGHALEGRLLEILDELAEESPDGYADMDELAERAARHGLDGERMEELLNYLSENGTLEEPLVGKFRRAEGPPRG